MSELSSAAGSALAACGRIGAGAMATGPSAEARARLPLHWE